VEDLLAVRGLVKSFEALMAVREVDFSLPQNEIRAIIGPNGAGKTTFFNLLTGHLSPTRGKIIFKGEDITGLSPAKISHKGMSRSFQITNLFPNFSALENIRIAVQSRNRFQHPFTHVSSLKEEREKAEKILESVGLKDMAEILAPNLSHGDQRHLEIGIALATTPILLLLDEPTAGMSPAETTATAKLIKKIAREEGLTIIIVEHDMGVVMEVADTISVFHQGGIIAEGSPEAIKKNEDVQEAYLKGTPLC
jgi:branched-chain amino acid transport system ATP-binding protein